MFYSLEVFACRWFNFLVCGQKNCGLSSQYRRFHENPHAREHNNFSRNCTHDRWMSHVLRSSNQSRREAIDSKRRVRQNFWHFPRPQIDCKLWMCKCIARMKFRSQIRNCQRIIDAHSSSWVSMSGHVNYSGLLRLIKHRDQQVRQQKMAEIIHLKVSLKAVGCFHKRMKGNTWNEWRFNFLTQSTWLFSATKIDETNMNLT